MISLILQAIVPVAFVIALGYYAGRSQLISQDGARNFSTYIVNFALPCTLFVGAFNFTPAQFENVPYLLTLTLTLVLPFIAGIGIGLFLLKKPLAETSLFACNCGFPDMAYFGLPVLMTVVGAQALLPVIVGNLVTSILIVPAIVLMLHHGTAETVGVKSSPVLRSILSTVRQPVVWAPILGLILVLAGVTLPSLAKGSIKQIGDTTGGVALFTLGVLLSPLKIRVDLATIAVVLLKNLVMPAIAFALSRLFGLDGLLTKGAIIAAACPAATIGAMFSAKFQIGQKTVPAEILASNIVGIASMAFWIFIVEEMR